MGPVICRVENTMNNMKYGWAAALCMLLAGCAGTSQPSRLEDCCQDKPQVVEKPVYVTEPSRAVRQVMEKSSCVSCVAFPVTVRECGPATLCTSR